MNREMRRAWRRDIKERKRHKKRMTTVEQTPTDPRTAGNNDKLWDEVTEDENLQQLLYDFMTMEPIHTEAFGATARLQEWLGNNIRGCAAIVVQGQWTLSNVDPGYPDEYCDNLVAPDHGEYCEEHEAE